MSEQRIILVRHGRSAHLHAGWVDFAGFLRWREAYEAAGIDVSDAPPPQVRELARHAMIVASDTPRAIESARLVAPGAAITTSPLLRELGLAPLNLGRLRLPLMAWALSFAIKILARTHVLPAERERAHETARWLIALAEQHGRVVAVTHASFRAEVAKALKAEGWRVEVPKRRSAHWSAWTFTTSS